MTFDWHVLYPLHTVILDNSQVFGGVPCKAQLCNFSKWFFSPRFGVVPIWELWQFCYVRIGPPKPSVRIGLNGQDRERLDSLVAVADCVARWLRLAIAPVTKVVLRRPLGRLVWLGKLQHGGRFLERSMRMAALWA